MLNCVLVGVFLGIYGFQIDIGIKYIIFAFAEIQAVMTVSVLHGLLRRTTSKKLKMKNVIYTLTANVLPLIIGIVIRILILCSVIHTDGMYGCPKWILISHFLSGEMFFCGLLGFVFQKTLFQNI
ncbi:MAG: hypothetical protein ACI4JZ_04685 [Oscillospiraceae bacterium]